MTLKRPDAAPSRPWYCSDTLVEDHKASIADGGDLRMYKAFKLLRSIIVNAGVLGLGFYALYLGADPLLVLIATLTVIGGYNSLEVGDYVAVVQAWREVKNEQVSDGGDQ